MMKMTQVQKMAKGMGIKPGKMKKAELIQTIQMQEGNFACFMTAGNACDQEQCCWREDCLTH